MLAGVDRVDHRAVLVEDFHLEIAQHVTRAHVVRDGRIFGTAMPRERIISFRPSAISVEVLNGVASLQEDCVLRKNISRKLPQWTYVVDDPNAASMRRQHQIR